MARIKNYKYLITYKVNGKKETVGCKTKTEKQRVLKMMKHANLPNSGYRNKYTNIKTINV